MLKQFYEIYTILNPQLEEKQIQEEISNIEKILKDNVLITNIKIEEEGLKRLAYPINKYNNGYYVLIEFELDLENCKNLLVLQKKLNLSTNIWRYLILNRTNFLKQKSKEQIKDVDIADHREFNKGKKKKSSFPDYLGYRDFDYKDVDFLKQFTSPYAKIFSKTRTGNSSKSQRKIALNIKRARHMALLPFTTKHFE